MTLNGKIGRGQELQKYLFNMKKFEVLLISFLLIIFCAITVNVVFDALTGSKLFDYKLDVKNLIKYDKEENKIYRTDVCSVNQKLNISDVSEPHLIQYQKYQSICNSAVSSSIMIFIDMPKDSKDSKESAVKVSETLKKLKDSNIMPLVIIEPVTDWGLIDFNEFSTGFYDAWIDTFFKELKQQGIESKDMGLWVPFPEANLPLWNHANTSPDIFAKNVNRYLKIYKKHYPDAKSGILLNSATYELDDFEWVSGDYVSLVPYVKNLDKNLVDVFGLQGLPWAPTAGSAESGAVLNAAEFLSSKIADEAATEMGVKEIWLNTGTFGAKYTQDSENTTYITPSVRADILNAILKESEKLKSKGYDVTVNIFAQDKSKHTEATDWSYLQESFSGSVESESIFVKFAASVNAKGIKLSIFDRLDKKEDIR